MRTIERSSAFKRDYKREAKGKHRTTLDADLMLVLAALANDQPLQVRYRDHDLSSNWAGYREKSLDTHHPVNIRQGFGKNSHTERMAFRI